jgi:hypothetical protein
MKYVCFVVVGEWQKERKNNGHLDESGQEKQKTVET